MHNFFKEIVKKIPKKIRNYNRLSMGIAGRIDEILEERKISQRDFAKKMKKSESEISKWMSGKHNFTIKSIANIEAKLDIKLIYTEYDLEDIKTRLDKKKNYFVMFEDVKHIEIEPFSIESRKSNKSGSLSLLNKLIELVHVNEWKCKGYTPHIDKSKEFESGFFESIHIISYNDKTKNYEVNATENAEQR